MIKFTGLILFARHGYRLGGESPLRVQLHPRRMESLANGKGVAVMQGLKEAGGKPASLRTETAYKAVCMDESAR